MRTSSSAETFTTAPRTFSTAATTGVRRAGEGRSSGAGSASGRAGARRSAARRAAPERCTALGLVVVPVLGLTFHQRFDGHRLLGEVGEGLQVLLVVLLVDDVPADVALDDALVDLLVLELVGHDRLDPWEGRENRRRLAGPSSACYPTAMPDGAARRARLHGLYAIVARPEEARAAIEGGAGVLQVRVKDAPSGEVLRTAREVVALAAGRALVLVNDRADLALLSGADGVHVGDEDLPPSEARRLLGPDLLVGRTTRTLAEARAAIGEGADHVGFGPIFATRTKALAVAPRGVEALREVAAALGAPVVAIGGIAAETIGEVAGAGAACAAVVGAIFGAGDPVSNARRLAD